MTSPTVLALAVLYLAFSLIIALSWRIGPLAGLLPRFLTDLLFPLDKSNLSPLRLLHFIALAILAVWIVPHDWRGLKTPVMRGAMHCGQHSLPIYCLGVMLAFASHVALFDISDGLVMQIALSLGGILAMIVAAILLNSMRTKPRQQPPRETAPAHDAFVLARAPGSKGVDAFRGREGAENYANPQLALLSAAERFRDGQPERLS